MKREKVGHVKKNECLLWEVLEEWQDGQNKQKGEETFVMILKIEKNYSYNSFKKKKSNGREDGRKLPGTCDSRTPLMMINYMSKLLN